MPCCKCIRRLHWHQWDHLVAVRIIDVERPLYVVVLLLLLPNPDLSWGGRNGGIVYVWDRRRTADLSQNYLEEKVLLYLTESVFRVVLQQSIPASIRQLTLHHY